MKSKHIYPAALVVLVGLLSFCFVKIKYAKRVVIKNPQHSYRDLAKIQFKETISFSLDSVTAPENLRYFQVAYWKDKAILYMLNNEINVIYGYDLQTQRLKTQLTLDKFDINLNNQTQGFRFISEDSLLLYTYRPSRLNLVSLSKGPLASVTVNSPYAEKDTSVYPFISARTPIIYDEKSKDIFLPGFYADEGGTYEENRKLNNLVKCNFSTNDLRYLIHYPPYYWGNNWGGGGGFRQTYFEVADSKVIASFMADNNLYVYSGAGKQDSVYAGSKYIAETRSMPFGPNYFDFLDSYDIYKYYLSTASYGQIKYDKYRRLYYRIAELPIDNPDVNNKSKSIKPKSIIILNNAFEKIGEQLLPANVDANYFIITEQGLCFKEINNDDTKLTFQLFTLKS